MKKKLIVVFSLAFLLRLAVIFIGYHGDLNNNISWGIIAQKRGLKGYYEIDDVNNPNQIGNESCLTIPACEVGWPYSAPNQPPLTILMFSTIDKIYASIDNLSNVLNIKLSIFPSKFIWFWEERGLVLLIKLPGILADLGIGWFIYKYFSNKKDSKKALLISSVWLFNPAIIYNSSVWGQTDSIVNLLGLLAVASLLKKNLTKFSVLFTLSFLFKGSLGIFIPILGFIALKQGYRRRQWISATCYTLLSIFIVTVWFYPHLDLPIWLINLYKNRILPGEIGYLTANAFNFWWLVNPGKVLDSTIYFGIPARVWGILLTLAGYGGLIYWNRKKIIKKRILFSLILVPFISFLFMTRIHERYLYPFFPYATIALGYGYSWVLYVVVSIVHLLNLYNMFWVPNAPFLENLLQINQITTLLSLVNIVIFVIYLRQLRSSKL